MTMVCLLSLRTEKKHVLVTNPAIFLFSKHIFLANGTSCDVSILYPAIQAIMVSWSAHNLQTENL
jgi:hypothetical protein